MNPIIIEPVGVIENYVVSPYSADGYYEPIGTMEYYNINVFSADGSSTSGYVFGQSQSDKDLLKTWQDIYKRLVDNFPRIGTVRGGANQGTSEREIAYAKADKEAKDEENRLIGIVNKAKKDLLPYSAWQMQIKEAQDKISQAQKSKVGRDKKVEKATKDFNDLLYRIKEAEKSGKRKVYEHEERLYAFRTQGMRRDAVDKPVIFTGSSFDTVQATAPIKTDENMSTERTNEPTDVGGSKLKPILIGVLVIGTLVAIGRVVYKSVKNK